MQPSEIGWGTSATDSSLRRFQYGYGTTNNNGNVLSQTITAAGFTATQTYGYDALNRLTGSAEGAAWARTYDHDQYGNGWVTVNTNLPLSGVTPVAQSWFNAANNRIVGYAYEPSGTGNLTGANGWTYSYDGENRLKQAETTVNGTIYTNTYQYDGEGRRVKKTVGAVNTVYVYDAMGQMIAEYTDDTAPQTAGTQYLMADHLGSTRAVLDALSNTLSCHDYLPFGEDLTAGRESATCYNNTDSVKQKFTGKERDVETGLDFFGARYSSAAQGRFTSPDWSATPEPIPYADLRFPQSLNLYSYAQDNPLSLFDMDGHCESSKDAPADKRCQATKDLKADSNLTGHIKKEETTNKSSKPDLKVYDDGAGNLTVGYGHKVTPADNLKADQQITEQQAQALVDKDVEAAAKTERDKIGVPLSQNEFNALTDLVYNAGPGVLDKSAKLLKALQDGDYAAAANELKYTKANGRVMGGLVDRSDKRKKMYEGTHGK